MRSVRLRAAPRAEPPRVYSSERSLLIALPSALARLARPPLAGFREDEDGVSLVFAPADEQGARTLLQAAQERLEARLSARASSGKRRASSSRLWSVDRSSDCSESERQTVMAECQRDHA
jgi:hypothetical protein